MQWISEILRYQTNTHNATWSIVERARTRASTRKEVNKLLGYVETHHVVPNWIVSNDDADHLTAREHFICHLLLTKMFSDKNIYKR